MVFGSHINNHSPLISDDEGEEDDGNTPLPDGYKPSSNDVVCARGKAYWEHDGNKKYRELIDAATPRYSETTNKLEKTLIVSEIVQAVHKLDGKFIKKAKKGGPFVIVSEVFAREKVRVWLLVVVNQIVAAFFWPWCECLASRSNWVCCPFALVQVGQSLRDGLSAKYKSATRFKKQRKAKPSSPEKVTMNLDADKIVTSNRYVCQRIDELRHQMQSSGDLASDASIVALFSRTNSDILETIKRDTSMLQQYHETCVTSSIASSSELDGI